MSRPLRIEYPGAWYHVMNRGRRGEEIFSDKHDYQMFVDLLVETTKIWNFRISAYCLMPNHYHILVQTPNANISRGMRHLNGVYTQRFNRRHFCDGPLFRGRYKSILVGGDAYLLQLVRYIHRNPLKAGLTDEINKYVWSSHKGYLSVARKWEWLHKRFIFSILANDTRQWLKQYKRFMSVETDKELIEIIESKRWPSIMGPSDFIDWVKGKYHALKADDDIPQSKELAPGKDAIIKAVCDYWNVAEDDLVKSKRGQFNEARNVAIYLTRILRHDSLQEICAQFKMNKYSSVSSVIERMKAKIDTDRQINKYINGLCNTIKSQEQT
ncbi:MAG: transposase [Planctomycetes bacterium]|nr:transposase [Planctomycetota bacterium]